MKDIFKKIVLSLASMAVFQLALYAGGDGISSGSAEVKIGQDGNIVFKAKSGTEWMLSPVFEVFYTDRNPKLKMSPSGLDKGVLYNVPTWERKGLEKKYLLKMKKASDNEIGDGFDDSIIRAKNTVGRTANVWVSAPSEKVKASSVKVDGDTVIINFPENEKFSLIGKIYFQKGSDFPVFEYSFKPKVKGYYSVAFVGAPEFDMGELKEIWQPFIWQGKRFPVQPFATPAFECSLPATFINKGGEVFGVAADTLEIPFMPLPKLDNSRFAVALRTLDGKARSSVISPMLGGAGSLMNAGDTYNFKMRLFSNKGDITDAYERMARNLFKMRDYRHNDICSINETLENMIAYSMSGYAQFLDDMKGCSYATDAPGTVKNVSCLNPLEIALVTDSEEMYEKRAYPIMEYLLSREKFLLALDRNCKIQNPSRNMNGPCTPVSEMAVLYGISGGASPMFMMHAKELFPKYRVLNLNEVSGGSAWQDALDIYLNGGGDEYLQKAKDGAEKYIAKYIDSAPGEFDDQSFFWTSFAPRFVDLYRLYGVTKDPKHLEAARKAARLYAMFVWMCPQIPDEKITVNPDGMAPWYGYLKSKGHERMVAPREDVEAWRLSEIGLTPESSGTMSGHRGIFMTHYAPWFMRIGAESKDRFLCDIARNAVVGRYRNFPGYHINTDRTTIYEKVDYPLRDPKKLSVNSFHYNHILPMISMLIDYLVGDIQVRSGGEISFPARYIEAYSYLQSNFYGDRAGTFFGRKAYIWLPRGLLDSTSNELNWLSARGENGGLYIAFANQSRRSAGAKITLNKKLAGLPEGDVEVLLYKNSEKTPYRKVVAKDGVFEIDVSAMGLVSAVIESAKPAVKFQKDFLARSEKDAWKKDYAELSVGRARAMIINFGPSRLSAFVYLRDDDSVVRKARLKYKENGEEKILEDKDYPYEFTVKLSDKDKSFDFELETELLDGSVKSQKARLEK